MAKEALLQNLLSTAPLQSTKWGQFSEQLLHKLKQAEGFDTWVKQALPELHQQLLADPEYKQLINNVINKPLQQYSFAQPLFNNSLVNANLVAIEKDRALPFHDHPAACGLMLVIYGRVKVYSCDIDNKHLDTTCLHVNKINELDQGNTNWFTESKHNIHRVEPVSQRSVLLVIHTPVFSKQKQSFYFPFDSCIKEGANLQAQRISGHALGNFSINRAYPQVLNQRQVG